MTTKRKSPFDDGCHPELWQLAIKYEDEFFRDMSLQEPWSDPIREELEERGDYGHFPRIEFVTFSLKENDDEILGSYDIEEQHISVVNGCEVTTLLHEMIHYYDHALERLSPAVRELVLVVLWEKVSKNVDNLLERCSKFLELVEHNDLEAEGGQHGLLFLLKSFDIDIRLELPLFTTLGYGYTEDGNNEG